MDDNSKQTVPERRCQQFFTRRVGVKWVSSVKWASPKTNILIAEAGCVETDRISLVEIEEMDR